MGAQGGVELIRAWRRSTCKEVYDERPLWRARESAVRCCNARIIEAEARREEAKVKKSFAKVRKPRVRFTRDAGRLYAAATAKCPVGTCRAFVPVRVEVGGAWNGQPTKKEAAKRAVALSLAGVAKHIRSWRHR